jgi:hypothetical protein
MGRGSKNDQAIRLLQTVDLEARITLRILVILQGSRGVSHATRGLRRGHRSGLSFAPDRGVEEEETSGAPGFITDSTSEDTSASA